MTQSAMHALCQAMRLEGFTPGDTNRVIGKAEKLLTQNGPEFLIDTLKVLKEHTLEKMVNPDAHHHFKIGEVSLKWNHKMDSPKGEFSLFYSKFPRPETRIRVIGAAIQAITLDTYSERQLERFMSGVTYFNHADEASDIPFSVATAKRLDKFIQQGWKNKYRFSAGDLTARSVPMGTYTENIEQPKKDLSFYRSKLREVGDAHVSNSEYEKAHRAVAYLDNLAISQMKDIPPSFKGYINTLCRQAGNDIAKIPSKVSIRGIKSRPYEEFRWPGNDVDSYEYYVGTIGFIQQGGAKLRTVCNVNRAINWALEPYAKALERAFYKVPQIAVLDQESGMEWAKQKLRQGAKLSSLDLSQATDLLDFRVMTRPLMKLARENNLTSLEASLCMFNETAEGAMFVPALDGSIRFRTGQPLGAKGSFQTLSVMNYIAGMLACQRTGLTRDEAADAFRIVGDDFICETRIAEEYGRIIDAWSGKSNAEKALESDKYGEFLSHIMTPGFTYITKPKYRPGKADMYINAEKATINNIKHYYRLTSEDKTNLELLASIYRPELRNIPSFTGVDTRLKYDESLLVAKATGMVSELRSVTDDGNIKLSAHVVDMAHQEQDINVISDPEKDNRIYTVTPSGDKVYTGISRPFVRLEEDEFSDTVTRFDHHTNQYVNIDDLKGKAHTKSVRDKSRIIQAIRNYISNNEDSKIELPFNEETTAAEVAVAALDDIEKIQEEDAQSSIPRTQLESARALFNLTKEIKGRVRQNENRGQKLLTIRNEVVSTPHLPSEVEQKLDSALFVEENSSIELSSCEDTNVSSEVHTDEYVTSSEVHTNEYASSEEPIMLTMDDFSFAEDGPFECLDYSDFTDLTIGLSEDLDSLKP